jgi:hypothetical protein
MIPYDTGQLGWLGSYLVPITLTPQLLPASRPVNG